MGFEILAILALSTLVYILYGYWWRSTERKSMTVRGGRVTLPMPHRLLPDWFGYISGHTLRLDKEKLTHQLEEWADRYGGDYELRISGKRVLVITDVADMLKVMAFRPFRFRRGLSPTQFRRVAGMAGFLPTMFFDEGKEWGRSRRIIAPSLRGHNVEEMMPAMNIVAERACSRWAASAERGEIVDVRDAMSRYAHDVICLAGMGLQISSIDVAKGQPCPTLDALYDLSKTFMKLILEPQAEIGWKYFPSLLEWVKKTKENSALLDNTVHEILKRTRAEIARGSEGGKGSDTAASGGDRVELSRVDLGSGNGKILRKIVSAGEAGSSTDRMTFSDEHIVKEVKSLFFAGTDSTSISLTWAIYYVTKHPEVHARCRGEALEAAPQTQGMVSTPEQLSRLVFCTAVFMEALRLRPTASNFFFHCAGDFTTKDGVKAPEGTGIVLLTRYAGRSEDLFTKANEFIPERWIEAEREEALLGKETGDEERKARHCPEAMLAFGSGPRVCPGQDLARTEAVLFLAAMCARFSFVLAPGQADPPEEIVGFTTAMRSLDVIVSKG